MNNINETRTVTITTVTTTTTVETITRVETINEPAVQIQEETKLEEVTQLIKEEPTVVVEPIIEPVIKVSEPEPLVKNNIHRDLTEEELERVAFKLPTWYQEDLTGRVLVKEALDTQSLADTKETIDLKENVNLDYLDLNKIYKENRDGFVIDRCKTVINKWTVTANPYKEAYSIARTTNKVKRNVLAALLAWGEVPTEIEGLPDNKVAQKKLHYMDEGKRGTVDVRFVDRMSELMQETKVDYPILDKIYKMKDSYKAQLKKYLANDTMLISLEPNDVPMFKAMNLLIQESRSVKRS